MKIVFVTRNLWGGGAEKVISILSSKMVFLKHEVEVICLSKPNPFYSIDDKVKINSSFTNIKKRFIKYYRIGQYLKSSNQDVIVCLPEEIGIYLRFFYTGKSKFFTSERNDPLVFPTSKIARLIRNTSYRLSDGIIFQTEKQMSFFPKSIQKKGIIIENPIDLNSLPKKSIKDSRKRVISAGRFDKQKNFSMLIRAFSRVVALYPNYELVIYGEGQLRDQLLLEASQLLPKGTYSFPGKTSELLSEIEKATCFVLSSDYEGLPNVIIEALCIGIPCVSTDTKSGGPRSLIKDNINGYLVAVGDFESLSEKIIKIIQMNENGVSLPMNIREVRSKFASISVARKWLNYFNDKCGV